MTGGSNFKFQTIMESCILLKFGSQWGSRSTRMSKLRSKFALLVLLRTQLMSRVIERSSYNCSGCSNSRFFCVKTYSINNLAGYEKRILCFETRKDVNDIKVEVHDNCLSVSLTIKKREQVTSSS